MSHESECDEAWKWPDFMGGRGIDGSDCWMCGLIRRIEARKDAEWQRALNADLQYAAGIAAARDAVAGVEMGGEHFWSVGFRDGITIALAAIDAIRGEQA